MKIVIATDNFLPRIDGIARFLEQLLYHMKEHQVTVIAPAFLGIHQPPTGIKIVRVPLTFFSIGDYRPSLPPSRAQLSSIDDADLVFAQTIGPIGAAAIQYAHRLKKKIVSFVHSIEWILVEKSINHLNFVRSAVSILAKQRARKIYNLTTALIVPSANVGEILSAEGIRISKYIVHLGIDTEKFVPGDKSAARKKLGLSEEEYIVGYVGRIAREKSLMTLYRAFKRLHGNNRLLIVGDGIQSVKTQLSGSTTTILDKEMDVVSCLQAMDVFVMPSLIETTCFAALEAMSCEIPVIATPVGSMKEYIVDKETGLLFPKENDAFLGIKLAYLKDNPIKARSISRKARLSVLQDYDMNKSIPKLMQVLKIVGESQ